MKIVGVDLSLTATGIDECGTPIVFKPRHKGMERLEEIRSAVTLYSFAGDIDPSCLVVLEGYSFGSKNSQAHALGELGGVVRHALWRLGRLCVDVPPTCLKKFATGKGNANKDEMVATAARLGCPANDNNAVDAWWLRQMGCYAYGLPGIPVSVTAYRNEAVAKIGKDWPVL